MQALLPETDKIREDLEVMTRGWDKLSEPVKFEIRAFKDGKPKPALYALDWIDEAVDYIEDLNARGYNIYAVRNPIKYSAVGSASDEDILCAFYHWADCDDGEASSNVKRFDGPQYNAVVITGTKPAARVHAYWRLTEPTYDLEQWRRTQESIANHFKSDKSVVNPSRIMRVAGTVSYPDKKKQAKGYEKEVCQLVERGDREPVTVDQMRRVFPALSTGGLSKSPSDWIDGLDFDSKTASDYADALRRARTDGEKHTGVRDLAASLAGQGVNMAMAEAIIRHACPVWDDNAEDLLRSAYEKFYKQPAEIEIKGDTLNTPDENGVRESKLERFAEIQPVLTDSYIIKNLLSQSAMSVVYGPSNSGKTFFTMDLAFHAATGQAWRGLRTNKTAVLYLAAEGGRGIANRMFALRSEMGHENAPIYLRRGGLDLLKSEVDLQAIYDFCAEIKADNPDLPLLCVIDTLSRVMAGGDENGPADMTQLIKNLDKIREMTGAHILLVHHSGKDAAKGARGHSSLRAATDTEIEIEEADEGGLHAATDTKQRDYNSHKAMPFTLRQVALGMDQDGDEITTCVVEQADASEQKHKKRKLSKNQKLVLDCFELMISDGLTMPNQGGTGWPEAGTYWVAPADDLRVIFEGKYTGKNHYRAFTEALDGLTAEGGQMVMNYGFVWRLDRKVSQ